MTSPDFVIDLRKKIGHAPLWLPGVGAVVLDGEGRVLLGQRSDNAQWAIITGMLEPGEEPAAGVAREVLEETGVIVQVERLVATNVVGPVTFPNGDVCSFLNQSFRCRYLSGEARVNDDESLQVRWFTLEELPKLNEAHLRAIALAQEPKGAAWFIGQPEPVM
ncbi:phosphohydrolase (MutT/nudix family protein) [Renibacterium salmoninarum ATCC 33209]|uniref:Phosphohydrolase (MutT/nudix family protein) n=1 Tax=Renibacterium salmoninarum (strain ATCC 33209 / DSM 20767 / JCM 11484 / NBRC 15589 / NCIMB 2235) TaxID=288705 RepID=A9WU90_RENSM|nr:NUDIX domain-containing protein [Renibacterium salmoninarum]ABY24761.1 phosphohydrolase (MutT/nudix family protein) [Renibacterium salmoninarum ATCC 33209]